MSEFKDSDLTTFPITIINERAKSLARKPLFGRLMSKSGNLNLQPTHLPYKYLRFTKDFANTLVTIRWRWVLLIVLLINVFFYLVFAGLFMFDAWLSGDFVGGKADNYCIKGANQFIGYLMLSIETITTTGYGYHYPTEHCYLFWVNLTLSTIVMVLLDGAFISVVFLKICKPLRRDALTMFSRRAVIGLRNGKLCLILRIYDQDNKHLIGSHVSLHLINKNWKPQSQFSIYVDKLEIQPTGALLWPVDIVHEINESSPFWTLAAPDFMTRSYEIFATISGSSAITGQFSTTQTSFSSPEILWGHRFKPSLVFSDSSHRYIVNPDAFGTAPCATPLCSAQRCREIKGQLANHT